MNAETLLKSWASQTIDFFLPPACAACGSVGHLFCPACRDRCTWILPPACARCGASLNDTPLEHHECVPPDTAWQQLYAPLAYRPPLSTAIQRLKYEGFFALAEPLAGLLIRGWPRWWTRPDLIIPVPLHARRRRERGFNQSALLARRLAAAVELPLTEDALRRIRYTVPQVGLNPEQRLANVGGAFAAAATAVRGRHIVLVDDVFTTGATMQAAAAALCDAGAASVSAYTLARTVS